MLMSIEEYKAELDARNARRARAELVFEAKELCFRLLGNSGLNAADRKANVFQRAYGRMQRREQATLK